jgi:HK97 family phage portal protein
MKRGDDMGLMDKIKKRFSNTQISIDGNIDDPLLKALLGNESITREKAMNLPAVSSNVNFISNMIASMPIKLYRNTGSTKEEIINDYRLRLLNYETKDILDAFQWKKALVSDYLMGKGGYSYVKWQRNMITGLYYIEDRHVHPYKNEDPIYKRCEFLVNSLWYRDFEVFRILRDTKDGITGVGLTDEISKALETSFATMLYQLNLIKKGGNKKGFLTSQRRISDEAITNLKNAWKRMYQTGEENCVVLNDGIDFKESSNSSVEMQINESKKTLDTQIDKAFHIKDDFNDTFKEGILPILTAFESSLNKYMLLEKEKKNGYFFAFDITELTKANMKERYEAFKIAKETGWITLNEIRYKENYDEIEGLDIIAMSLGNVVYDINKKEYYTPNTGQTKSENAAKDEKKEPKSEETTEKVEENAEKNDDKEPKMKGGDNDEE